MGIVGSVAESPGPRVFYLPVSYLTAFISQFTASYKQSVCYWKDCNWPTSPDIVRADFGFQKKSEGLVLLVISPPRSESNQLVLEVVMLYTVCTRLGLSWSIGDFATAERPGKPPLRCGLLPRVQTGCRSPTAPRLVL